MKKSQVTLFIILGVALLAIVGLVIYLVSLNQPDDWIAGLEDAKSQISALVSSCIEQTSVELLDRMALNAGTLSSNSTLAYQTNAQTFLTVRTLSDIENELAANLEYSLPNCINLDRFRELGFNIETKDMSADVVIGRSGAVEIRLLYPMNISRQKASTGLDEFTKTVNHPFRSMYDIAVDILNAETREMPVNTENIMLDNPKLSIHVSRPYPGTAYSLQLEDKNRIIIFNFLIKGTDTVSSEILYPRKPSTAACRDESHDVCYQNMEDCNAPLSRAAGTECDQNAIVKQHGCCIMAGSCEVSDSPTACSGRYENESCNMFSCPNFDCDKTYNAVDQKLTGEKRLNSESWCVYDSRPGWGRDYVGARHYRHSCIYGKEYVEECRDYREELCTRNTVLKQNTRVNVAECKTNRWWDCGMQTSAGDCNDITKRDCMWMGDYYSPWYTKSKCVPFVPPGFRFWESQGADVCNFASENPPKIARKYPKTWSYSNFLACIRMGDCGNYRNVADRITKAGYFHPLGEPEPWVYWDNGWIYDGNSYGITDRAGNYEVGALSIARSSSPAYVVCSVWQAPADSTDCELCNSNPFHQCTEYKCRSLGKCSFINGICSKTSFALSPINIRFDVDALSAGYRVSTMKSDYYPDAIKNTVSPDVPSYENITFGIIADRPSRCALNLKPPMMPDEEFLKLIGSGFSPQLWLSDAQLATKHNITTRLPSPETAKLILPRWQLFVQCTDSEGNSNRETFYIEVTVKNLSDGPPRILGVLPSELVSNAENDIELYLDRPFTDCRYAHSLRDYANMTSLGCSATEIEFTFDFGLAFVCRGSLVPAEQTMIRCSDSLNITGPVYALPQPG